MKPLNVKGGKMTSDSGFQDFKVINETSEDTSEENDYNSPEDNTKEKDVSVDEKNTESRKGD
jgi:hypothetical protein